MSDFFGAHGLYFPKVLGDVFEVDSNLVELLVPEGLEPFDEILLGQIAFVAFFQM